MVLVFQGSFMGVTTPRRRISCLICLLVFLATGTFYQLEKHGIGGDSLLRWEYAYRDRVTREGRTSPKDPRLVFLGIDSASLLDASLDVENLYSATDPDSKEQEALGIMSGEFPWPRSIYPLIIDRLIDAGAEVVVLDLLFQTPGEGDAQLQEAMRRHRGKVVLGANFVPEEMLGREGWKLATPTSTVLTDDDQQSPEIGFVNFWPRYGVVRQLAALKTPEEVKWGNISDFDPTEPLRSLAAQTVTKVGVQDLPRGSLLFRFAGPPDTFQEHSLFEIFVPKYWERNFNNGEAFRGKIVMVGPYGNWTQDRHPTPFGAMPGPELHLNAMNALLNHDFLIELPDAVELLLIMGGSVAALMLSLFIVRRTWLRFGGFLLVGTAYLALVQIGYNHPGVIILAMPPLLAFGASGLGCFVYEFTLERVEKLRVRRTLESYVSKDVVGEILDNPESYLQSLGGQRREVAILMTDIRGFTTITESMESPQLVALLNEYFTLMVDDIFECSGSVDKFIGDAILAVWGQIQSGGATGDVNNAVRAILRMRKSLAAANMLWKEKGWPPLAMGFGLNYGEVTFGNVGSTKKMSPTVIGDVVNVAARLESLTKEYHRDLLLGEAAAEYVDPTFKLQFLDCVAVKGKSKALKIYSILEQPTELSDANWSSYLKSYDLAQSAYQSGRFDEASGLFEACQRYRPEDGLIHLYLQRCHLLKLDPPANWTGVHVMKHK